MLTNIHYVACWFPIGVNGLENTYFVKGRKIHRTPIDRLHNSVLRMCCYIGQGRTSQLKYMYEGPSLRLSGSMSFNP